VDFSSIAYSPPLSRQLSIRPTSSATSFCIITKL
jgi:hypothetical protein